ncbi:uncharacterized protein LOC111898524 [Lactuca sativa]|nr:uncharacterized protein LOC111898524 [Lactuca sativa]
MSQFVYKDLLLDRHSLSLQLKQQFDSLESRVSNLESVSPKFRVFLVKGCLDVLLKKLSNEEIIIFLNRAETFDNLTNSVKIAMVGKYVGLTDSYLSVVKSLLHACIACSLKPSIEWIAASDLEDESARLTPEAHAKAWETLRSAACVLVPGGFGDRGVKGMIHRSYTTP